MAARGSSAAQPASEPAASASVPARELLLQLGGGAPPLPAALPNGLRSMPLHTAAAVHLPSYPGRVFLHLRGKAGAAVDITSLTAELQQMVGLPHHPAQPRALPPCPADIKLFVL